MERLHLNFLCHSKKLTTKTCCQLVLLLSLLFGAGFCFGIHLPLQKQAAAWQTEAEQNRQSVQEVQALQQRYGDFSVYAKKLGTSKQQLDKSLPDELSIRNFLLNLQKLAAAHDVFLTQIAPEKATTKKQVEVQPIKLQFTGSYFAIVDFLHDLRAQGRLVQMQAFSLKSTTKGSNLHGSCILCIYASAAAN